MLAIIYEQEGYGRGRLKSTKINCQAGTQPIVLTSRR